MMAEKILIVDDDADLRDALAIILEPLFRVIAASGGAEALELLKKERPRLMLLDVSMPGMSGIEVLAAAKTAVPALIVVMLTSQQDVELAAKALSLGAKEYVTKPFDADYIRAEVSRLIAPDKPADGRPWKVAP
jgi:putative two-component system response regulator